MEFSKRGEDLRIDTIYQDLSVLLQETAGQDDFAGFTAERELTPDDLWSIRDILSRDELPFHLQQAKEITLFHSEAEGDIEEDPSALPEGYVISVSDGQLTMLYGFYKTETGYVYDKTAQSTIETPALRLDDRTLGGAILELEGMPLPGSWAATLTQESRDNGEFADPNNWVHGAPKDLSEVAACVQEEEQRQLLEFTPEEVDAISEMVSRLRARGEFQQAG